MDKEIPKKEQRRESLRKWLKVAAAIAAVAVAVAVVMFLIGDSVSSADIRIRHATRGTLESSVAATGKSFLSASRRSSPLLPPASWRSTATKETP